MTVFECLCLRDAIMASSDPDRAWREFTTSSPEVVDRVAQVEREFAVYQRREGAFSRPSVLANAKTMEPAAWWSMYGKHLPLLSSIAPKVLAQAAAWMSLNTRLVPNRAFGWTFGIPLDLL